MNYLQIKTIKTADWSAHLNYISKMQGLSQANRCTHDLIVLKDERIHLINPDKINSASILRTQNILSISEQIFNQCTNEEKSAIVNGLKAISHNRVNKFKKLNCIFKIFAQLFGYYKRQENIDKRINSLSLRLETAEKEEAQRLINKHQQELLRQEQLRQEELKREEQEKIIKEEQERGRPAREHYLKDLKESLFLPACDLSTLDLTVYDNYPPEELEAWIRPIIENFDLHNNQEVKTTFFLLTEKTAERFQASNKFKEALDMRMLAQRYLSCDYLFETLFQYIQTNSEPFLGCKISPLGATALKNHVLHGSVSSLPDGKQYLSLEGKLNHYARKKLDAISSYMETQPQQFFASLPAEFCDGVTVKHSYYNYNPPKAYQTALRFNGVGKISFGAQADCYCRYSQIKIVLNDKITPELAGQKIYTMLSAIGLGELAHRQRAIDQERIKMYQIFRAYCPSLSYPLERDQSAFETSLPNLKVRMLNACSTKPCYNREKIADLFQDYLNSPGRMYQQEVYPGMKIWALRDLSEKIRQKGGLGLMTGVGSTGPVPHNPRGLESLKTFEESAECVVGMLKLGALSTEDRERLGISNESISPGKDIRSGGGDSVFCRIITTNNINRPIKKISFSGQLQLVFDLSLLDRGGYGYLNDSYGAKIQFDHVRDTTYKKRQNLIDLTNTIVTDRQWNRNRSFWNEICIKNRIPPEYIRYIYVPTLENKNYFSGLLKSEKLTYIEDNVEKINGIPLDQFIRTDKKFSFETLTVKL